MLELAAEDPAGVQDERGHRDAGEDPQAHGAGAAARRTGRRAACSRSRAPCRPRPACRGRRRAARPSRWGGRRARRRRRAARPGRRCSRSRSRPGRAGRPGGARSGARWRGRSRQPGGEAAGAAAQPGAHPVVVVEDGGIEPDAGERGAAPLAVDEVEPAAGQDLAREVAAQVVDAGGPAPTISATAFPVPRARTPKRGAGAERVSVRSRMWFTQETKVPSPPPVKTVPNPRETTVSAMRWASSGSREKKRLSVGHEPGQGLAHAGAHLLRVGVEQDGGLLGGCGAWRGPGASSPLCEGMTATSHLD